MHAMLREIWKIPSKAAKIFCKQTSASCIAFRNELSFHWESENCGRCLNIAEHTSFDFSAKSKVQSVDNKLILSSVYGVNAISVITSRLIRIYEHLSIIFLNYSALSLETHTSTIRGRRLTPSKTHLTFNYYHITN